MPVEASVATTRVVEDDDGDAFEVVVLAAGDRYVVVSPLEVPLDAVAADPPADAAGDRPDDAPDAHGLLSALVTELDAEVAAVRIGAVHNGTLRAELELRQTFGSRSRERVVAARAIDAITLALRVGCPILVAEDVVEAVGVDAETLAAEGVEV